MARVLDVGQPFEAFPVNNGVKQGCVLAPMLFSMVFSAMLTDAFRDCEPGINIMFRTDGKLFNPRRLQAVKKVKETVLRDFIFADDCALIAQCLPTSAQSTCRRGFLARIGLMGHLQTH